MSEEKGRAIITHYVGETHAEAILQDLERVGLAIYKKKVMKEKRRPTASNSITEGLKKSVLADYSYSKFTQSQIAARHNINPGRVAEIIREHREGFAP